ncbi:hypothetical protein HHK36_019653 [Tetracentron sinense]|uniref:Uncharacterized protein n=2 Tax=Tetracentron sinense TaxID=13715 RepID=A0A835D9C2_TETSI|nr:hypothetical protein HHK36_019653 [Tetracentron sinense]
MENPNQAILIGGEKEEDKGASRESSSQAVEEKDRVHEATLTLGNEEEEGTVMVTDLIKRIVNKRKQKRDKPFSIFRVPPSLAGISIKACQPEILSIGPYHRGMGDFKERKRYFLPSLNTQQRQSIMFGFLKFFMFKQNEKRTKECYSEVIDMPSEDFNSMMLFDASFILELLHLESNDDPDLQMPWLKPILMRDLLKLENQLPFFVLRRVYNISISKSRHTNATNQQPNSLASLFFRFLDLPFSQTINVPPNYKDLQIDHLLDLVHKSLTPYNSSIRQDHGNYRPSAQSIQCVTLLRSSGIKFIPHRETKSFLDIDFKRRVLKIPPITINEFTKTLFINCIALEQCRQHGSMYFTTYVAFMSCLIDSPRDVAFLCADGIISSSSENDQYVADLFNELGKNIDFNIRTCYLSKQFREVEAYYSSNWGTFIRTYFRSPWTFISVLSASVLLIFTAIQTIVTVMGYIRQF